MLIEDIDFIPENQQRPNRKTASEQPCAAEPEADDRQALKSRELRLMTSTLGSLLEGGIPILKALQVMRREAGSRKGALSGLLERIEERIRQGVSLSEAMKGEPRSFPVFYTQMIQAGESTGRLDQVLAMLTAHLEKEDERKRKMIEASAYPGIVLSLGVVTFAVLLKFVIPKISVVYADFEGELPALTRAVLWLSDWIVPFSLSAGVLAAAAVFYFRKRRRQAAGYLLRVPFIGALVSRNLLSVFSSLLALELKSGIPVLTAVDSVREAVGWDFFQQDLKRVREALAQGTWLADALRPLPWLPESACVLIQAGQESGRLPEALEQVHREASRDLETRIQFTFKILEPLLILAVGAIVGLLVLSAILPILEINALVR